LSLSVLHLNIVIFGNYFVICYT